jgi:hypothetical protein
MNIWQMMVLLIVVLSSVYRCYTFLVVRELVRKKKGV